MKAETARQLVDCDVDSEFEHNLFLRICETALLGETQIYHGGIDKNMARKLTLLGYKVIHEDESKFTSIGW